MAEAVAMEDGQFLVVGGRHRLQGRRIYNPF
jgi:hypothetical protein